MAVTEVLRATDLAALYGVDVSTVQRWERAGRVRPARRDPGGKKYWLAEEIHEDLLAAPEADPAPEVTPILDVAALVAATRRPRRRVGS